MNLAFYTGTGEIGDSCATTFSWKRKAKTETKHETGPTVHQNKNIRREGYNHSSFNILMWPFTGFKIQQGIETKTKSKNKLQKCLFWVTWLVENSYGLS